MLSALDLRAEETAAAVFEAAVFAGDDLAAFVSFPRTAGALTAFRPAAALADAALFCSAEVLEEEALTAETLDLSTSVFAEVFLSAETLAEALFPGTLAAAAFFSARGTAALSLETAVFPLTAFRAAAGAGGFTAFVC